MDKIFICGETKISRKYLVEKMSNPINGYNITDYTMKQIVNQAEEKINMKYGFYIKNLWSKERIKRVRKQIIEEICIELGCEYIDDIL